MEINLREMLKLKDELYNIFAPFWTNFWQSAQDSERDYWMKADEAKENGMIDEVLRRG
jgi:ATP-dependent Clp protease protease subunit